MTTTLTHFKDLTNKTGEIGSFVAVPISDMDGTASLEVHEVVGIREVETQSSYGAGLIYIVLDLQDGAGEKSTSAADNTSIIF